MLLPFQWAVITLQESKLLMKFIEESTSTKSDPKNYAKMQKSGVLEVYNALREFVESSCNYDGNLRYLEDRLEERQ